MDRELVTSIGAGLMATVSAFGIDVPRSAPRFGFHLLVHLADHDAEMTAGLITRAAASVWGEWRHVRLPRSLAQPHLEALPALLATSPFKPDELVGAFAATTASLRHGNGANQAPSRRLASQLIERSWSSGVIGQLGLNEQLAFFFVNQVLHAVLIERITIEQLRLPTKQYCDAIARAVDMHAPHRPAADGDSASGARAA